MSTSLTYFRKKNLIASILLLFLLTLIWFPHSVNAQVQQPKERQQQQQQMKVVSTPTVAASTPYISSKDTINKGTYKNHELIVEEESDISYAYYPDDNPITTPIGNSSSTRNSNTTSMLVRLIPVKLLVVLLMMGLVIAVRQMAVSAEDDTLRCCKCTSLLGGSRYAPYEGIDPTDVSDHQKSVEVELLQLSASTGDDDDSEKQQLS
mmetsp:Transcript_10158/g.10874  ORF Transcript_10158/g.10874 Transcript_10158/m.10874 type:complete len:207 (+) Transcript_10158:128-748(+)